MNPLCAFLSPESGHVHGIFGIDGYPVKITLRQTDALSVFDIDRRDNEHPVTPLEKMV
jgi:hypothetical protein